MLSIFRMFLFLSGRINVKRLSKWMKETLESSSGDDRAPPKGVIQMDLSLLHHLTKEAKHDLKMLLVPASKFITVSIYSWWNNGVTFLKVLKYNEMTGCYFLLTIGRKICNPHRQSPKVLWEERGSSFDSTCWRRYVFGRVHWCSNRFRRFCSCSKDK